MKLTLYYQTLADQLTALCPLCEGYSTLVVVARRQLSYTSEFSVE